MEKFTGHFRITVPVKVGIWLAGMLLGTSCVKKHYSDHPAPIEIKKVSVARIALPELIIYTTMGKKIIRKPAVWNSRTLSFSEGMPQTYVVKKGDNLYKIAEENSVPISSIIHKNNIISPYTIQPGQKLILLSPRIHMVAEEDDLYKIALLHKVNLSTLAVTNRLQKPYHLHKGQQLIVPASPVPAEVSNPMEGKMKTVQDHVLQPAKKGFFLRPVQGRVLSSYGEQGRGLYNDGVNIEAPLGAPVKVAENGVVVYVGNAMRSYGNLVLVRHADNWVSAYAHLDNIKVTKGQTLKRGEILGSVGKTGVKTPQLHFELRKGTKPVNPMLCLYN